VSTVKDEVFIHPSAIVDPRVCIGPRCRIWAYAHLREGAVIGPDCVIGEGVYVGADVCVGARSKLENRALVFEGASLADGVFIGPGAVLANDRLPRAVRPDWRLKTAADWTRGTVRVESGASIGANAVVVPNAHIGRWAMIGAASVVTGDVPDHAVAVGSPARVRWYACACGQRLEEGAGWRCRTCGALWSPPGSLRTDR
jgi:acetyltransferase-like isoleucine patch superfamily enzyme